jgi:hypothetical protein
MTFENFQQFRNWCKDNQEISVRDYNDENQGVIIENLHDTNGMIVCELMVSAYDSGFRFGPMHSDMDGGSIVIVEE